MFRFWCVLLLLSSTSADHTSTPTAATASISPTSSSPTSAPAPTSTPPPAQPSPPPSPPSTPSPPPSPPFASGTPWSNELNPRTGRPFNEIVIGGLGIRGEADLYQRWTATYEDWLNEHVDPALNLTFKLIYLNFDATYEAVEHMDRGANKHQPLIDMVFTNPSVYACLEREQGAAPVASLLNQRTVGADTYRMDKFYGTFIVRNDSDITLIDQIRGKVVEAVSLVGLGACQLQWNELVDRGISFMSAPKQVRFSGNQKKIITDVVNGDADVGMIRTDLYEAEVAKGTYAPGSLRVLEDRSSETGFPFPHSTALAAPEWSLGAFPWLDWTISRAVSDALYKIKPSDTAAKNGQYATWVAPLSYLGMHEMQDALGWIDADNKCIRNGDLCDMTVCPAGQVKKSCDVINSACEQIGMPCPDGYKCLCNPCQDVPTREILVSPKHRVSDQTVALGLPDNTPLVYPNQTACEKMTTCQAMQQSDRIIIQVEDAWSEVRTQLGVDAVQSVQYTWQGDQVWRAATALEAATFQISVQASTLGVSMLQVRTCMADGQCKEVAESPFLFQVDTKECLMDNMTPDLNGLCECVEGFSGDAEGICQRIEDSNDNTLVIVLVAVGVALVLFVVIVVLVQKHMNNSDLSWRIESHELVFPDPVVVLGRGTFGQVLRADFRGTDVAVKRVLPGSSSEEKARNELFDKQLSFSPKQQKLHEQLVVSDDVVLAILGDDSQEVAQRDSERDSQRDSRRSAPRSSDSAHSNTSVGTHIKSHNKSPQGSGDRASGVVKKQQGQAQGLDKKNKSDAVYTRASRTKDSAKSAASSAGGTATFGGDLAKTTMKMRMGALVSNQDLDSFKRAERSKRLTREFMEEMQVMVYLRHPNIVTVMGAVVHKTMEPLMVMENMKHGSLFDLLHNTTMHFDGEMLMAMLEDIVAGMNYLHSTSPPVLHNDLKTGNVLVGANFQAKLADFGLTMKEKSSGFLGTPFWMAPELFHVGTSPTTQTDVYSFAITMMEMFTREEPYGEHDDPEWVLEQLALGEDADELMRPTLPDGLPAAVKALIEACWHPVPAQRPHFPEIRARVAAFDADEISRWFEKLDAGTERAISDSEKQRRLLHEVFPPHIAKQLKEGKKVEPQQHECVTIFFSDIVGFTDISRQLKPFQVMNMLDRLYEKLDQVARKYTVFKVETIGDAYMAVANLVSEQPDHTKLIAKFAQEAITAANGTLIQEDAPELGCVNIRVGFHSGPVVSSVVGNMNPRFCLFGDTVNTSSRMESNSEKNRIHLSSDAAALLRKQAPEMKLLSRGEIPIKGKGTMTTFWLV